MPLDQYYDECDTFYEYIDVFMSNNFKITVSKMQ